MINKIPPQAIELEEAVIGALMLEKDAYLKVSDFLAADMFYSEKHAVIYQACASLFNQAKPIDILTVVNELKKLNKLEIVGGPYEVTQFTQRVASSAHVEHHSRIIQEKYILRKLIELGSEVSKIAYDESANPYQIIEDFDKRILHILNIQSQRKTLKKQLIDTRKEIEASAAHSGITGIPSSVSVVNGLMGGYNRTDLIIVAARPGMGKTSFALQEALFAAKNGYSVALFSLEMGDRQLIKKMLSAEADIDLQLIKNGNLSELDWNILNNRIGSMYDLRMVIDDTPALSIHDLRRNCIKIAKNSGLDMVVVDYLQLMRGEKDRNGNREQEISSITRGLKALAKELDVPVIALSQLSRECEKRGDKRPLLSDLRESGSIEQDADIVQFIFRPEYYGIQEDENGYSTLGRAEFIYAKNRNGSTGFINVGFVHQFTKFVN